MSLAQLLTHVAAEHRAEVERRYAKVSQGQETLADEHIDSFARILCERGLLTAEGLRDFLTYRELIISGGDDVDTGGPDAAQYEIMTLLGRGGMGEVYLGTQPSLKRTVAVKRLRDEVKSGSVVRQRFIREAQITAQLDHPAIVPVYGFERDRDGALAYAMKFVRGETLTAFIDAAHRQLERDGRADGPHSLKARVETFVPVLNAIAYAHRRGVIHRDLKPDNIMVGRFGEVLVMDWGIARLAKAPMSLGEVPLEDAGAGTAALPAEPVGELSATVPDAEPSGVALTTAPGLTRAGAVLGTPDFMSPEQARGDALDVSSDQYALGLILQELVTLEPAIPGRSSEAVLSKAKKGERAPVTSAREVIPRELVAIIGRATAARPGDRYESVEAMAEDVRRFLRDESVVADPDSGMRRVQRWIGNHRGVAMALGLGLVMLVFAVGAFVLWRGEVALDEERQQARDRERSIMSLGAMVDARARRMSEELHRYELLLGELAGSARILMNEPAPPSSMIAHKYAGGRRDPEEYPADGAVESAVYGQLASLRHADCTAAPEVDRDALRGRIDQLARLEPMLRRTLLASAGDEATRLGDKAATRLVLQRGVPLIWAYFAVEEGLGIGLPGTWDYEDSPGMSGYDHRREEWYIEGRTEVGPRWSSGADENGLGLLFTCTQALRDDGGAVIGVAGLDVAMTRFIDELLDVTELARAGAEALLLDREGRVLVRSSQKGLVRTLVDYQPVPYEDDLVVAQVKAAEVGHLLLSNGRVAFWASLGEVGLSYVVVGAEAALLAVVTNPP